MNAQEQSPLESYKSDTEATPTAYSTRTLWTSPGGLRVVHEPRKSYTPFMVRFPKIYGVKAGRRFFKTLEAAKEAIAELEGNKPSARIGQRAVDEYLYVTQLLGDTSLTTAVRFYLEHKDNTQFSVTFGQLSALFKEKLLNKSRVYRDRTGRTLEWVEKKIPSDTPFSKLNAKFLIPFIEGIDNYWRQDAVTKCLHSLFNLAAARQLIAADPFPKWRPEKPKLIRNKKPIYLPVDDVEALLTFVKAKFPEYLPAFALQLYAGIRTEELCRPYEDGERPLEWGDITRGVSINVPEVVAKTDEHRKVDAWSEKLTYWLEGYDNKSGPVMPYTTFGNIKSRIVKALQKERKAAGLPPIKWGQNILRHTFATYACAFYQNAGRAALLLGHHSVNLLFKHYRQFTEQIDAWRYFGKMTEPEYVLQFPDAQSA